MAYHSERALAEAAAFASVASAGGFSAAARIDGLRKATLTQRVRSLEQRLGVALLVRTTRSVRLTDEGRAYLDHARAALGMLRDGETAATSFRRIPTGTLRVTVLPPLASVLLAEVVAPYVERCPEVTVQLDSSIGHVDLTREPFDVAVRLGPLADSALVCRRLGRGAGGYFASPKYLARRGAPRVPEDLSEHDTVAIPRGDRLPAWRFARSGRSRTVVVRPRVSISTFEQGLAAAVAGIGIVPSPRVAVRDLLATGELVPVLAAWTPAAFDVCAVYPARELAAKTRIFLDALRAWFARRRGRL